MRNYYASDVNFNVFAFPSQGLRDEFVADCERYCRGERVCSVSSKQARSRSVERAERDSDSEFQYKASDVVWRFVEKEEKAYRFANAANADLFV